jgi:hypothetical protein
MNFPHSSTGKRIVNGSKAENDSISLAKRASLGELDVSLLLQSPSNSNTEALKRIRSRLAKYNHSADFPSSFIPVSSNALGLRNTFLDIFPCRNQTSRHRAQIRNFEDPDYPKKHFNRKADKLAHHRDAMIRARNLFPIHPR